MPEASIRKSIEGGRPAKRCSTAIQPTHNIRKYIYRHGF